MVIFLSNLLIAEQLFRFFLFNSLIVDAAVDWVDSSFRVVATGADATVVVVVSVVVSVVGSARKNAVVFVNS